MKERPILFSGEMVRAILAGRKTQTRRALKYQPDEEFVYPERVDQYGFVGIGRFIGDTDPDMFRCPYGAPGDRLWVREAAYITPPGWGASEADYNIRDDHGGGRIILYAASADGNAVRCAQDYHIRLRPSIHMPRWASRITLEITAVEVERLQEITPADVQAEGVKRGEEGEWIGPDLYPHAHAWESFRHYWDNAYFKNGSGWDSNPWVWKISFRRL